MKKPLVSVIIPVLNGERFIAEAIQSVLDQNYDPLEIIVVDDGSTDGTAELVKRITGNIRYYYQQNAGVAKARNKGVEMAKGDLIAFIDADDVWVKNKLELQLNCFNENPAIEIVFGLLIKTPLNSIADLNLIDIENEKGVLATQLGCMLIKKPVFETVGVFDEQMLLAEDLDWFHRIREAGINVLVQNEVVQFYRIHDQNITNEKTRKDFFMMKAYKKSLDRRRQSGSNLINPVRKLSNFDQVLKYRKTKGK